MKAREFYELQTHDSTCVVGIMDKDEIINLMDAFCDAEVDKMVSERLAPDEDVEVAIQDALYATGRFTTDECTILAEGILMYIKDHKIINLKTREK